jgi:hypothetical protein
MPHLSVSPDKVREIDVKRSTSGGELLQTWMIRNHRVPPPQIPKRRRSQVARPLRALKEKYVEGGSHSANAKRALVHVLLTQDLCPTIADLLFELTRLGPVRIGSLNEFT